MEYVVVEQTQCPNCDRELSEIHYGDITWCERCNFRVCQICLQTGPCWNCKINEQQRARSPNTEVEDPTEEFRDTEEASANGASQEDDGSQLQECSGGATGEKHFCKKSKMTRFGTCIDCFKKKTSKTFVKNKAHHEKLKKLDNVKDNINKAIKDVLEPWEEEMLGELLSPELNGEELYIELKAILMSKHQRNWRAKLKAVNVELQELLVGYGFAAVLVGYKPRQTGGDEYEVLGAKQVVSALEVSQDKDKDGKLITTSRWNLAREVIEQKLKQVYPRSRIPTVLQAELANKLLTALGSLKKIQKPISRFALSKSATSKIDRKILKALDGNYESKEEEEDQEDSDSDDEGEKQEFEPEDMGSEDFDSGDFEVEDGEEHDTAESDGNGKEVDEESVLDGCDRHNDEEVDGDVNPADSEDYENYAEDDLKHMTDSVFRFSSQLPSKQQRSSEIVIKSSKRMNYESDESNQTKPKPSPALSKVQKPVPSQITKLLSPQMNEKSSLKFGTSNAKLKEKSPVVSKGITKEDLSSLQKRVFSPPPVKSLSSKVDKNRNQFPLSGGRNETVLIEKKVEKERRSVAFDNIVNFVASSWNRNFDDKLISDNPEFYSNLAHMSMPKEPALFEQATKSMPKKRKLEKVTAKANNKIVKKKVLSPKNGPEIMTDILSPLSLESTKSKKFDALDVPRKRPKLENSMQSSKAQKKKKETINLLNNTTIPNSVSLIETNGNLSNQETSGSIVEEAKSAKKSNLGNFKPPAVNILSRVQESSSKLKKNSANDEKENSNLDIRKINENKKNLPPPIKTCKSKNKNTLKAVRIKTEPIKGQATAKDEPIKGQITNKAKAIKGQINKPETIKDQKTNKTVSSMRNKLRMPQLDGQNDGDNEVDDGTPPCYEELNMVTSASKKSLAKPTTVETLEAPAPTPT